MVGLIKKYQQFGKPLMYLGALIFFLSLINAKYPSSPFFIYNFQNAKVVYGYNEVATVSINVPSFLRTAKDEGLEKSVPLSIMLSAGVIFFVSGMYIMRIKIK
ncbi:MAG: hypothetical protein HN782_01605 [Candidatus Marinimicrobia bacterium]|jgi:hypothetical protein|nr:hypothetical protein [Candidatus Neomarinimicrobiota bacterium]